MYRVLVFPSCNEPGLEIVHALSRSNKVQVIGGSSGDVGFDPSRMILREHLRCPHLSDPGFKEGFTRLLAAQRIDTVFPATDSLVEEFSRWRVEGVTFVTTGPDTAGLLMSKSKVYERLARAVPVPKIYSAQDAVFPAYAKPDRGAGSRGHSVVQDRRQLADAIAAGLLVMEYLPGEEYTVDCVNDLQGRLLFCGPRLRGRIGRGIALGSKTLEHPRIESHIRAITGLLRIEGPWFAQFKLDAAGRPTLMEINARVGGSMTTTRLAGVNIPLLALFLYKGFPVEVPAYDPALVLNRCLSDHVEGPSFRCVLWDLDDTLVRKDGKPDPEAVAALYDCHNRGIKQLLLTKNPGVGRLLDAHVLPPFFDEVLAADDKLAAVGPLLERHHVDVADCVMVDDSNTEKLALHRALPGLRVIGPDALAVLGREKL